jgi:hypothetical protein
MMTEKVLVTDVLKALADENSFGLFNTICTGCTDSQKLMSTFGLSKRQYYDRMNDLRSSGLIKRQRGMYDATSFGKIFYSILIIAEKATERHWKLQALDMMNLPANGNSLGVDYMKIIDILLDDNEIKEILLRGKIPSNVGNELFGYPKSKQLVHPFR